MEGKANKDAVNDESDDFSLLLVPVIQSSKESCPLTMQVSQCPALIDLSSPRSASHSLSECSMIVGVVGPPTSVSSVCNVPFCFCDIALRSRLLGLSV